MKAYELLAKLRHLTLSGYEDGHYEFIGTQEQWNRVDQEMATILENWDAYQGTIINEMLNKN